MGHEGKQNLLGNFLQVSLVANAIFTDIDLLLALCEAVSVCLMLTGCLDSCKKKTPWVSEAVEMEYCT